jgi:Uma2 family endonuclease
MLADVVAGKAPPLEPLTIGQVEQMMAHGILTEGAPIELIDGLLVRKDRSTRGGDPMTHHPKHAGCVVYFQSLSGSFAPHGCHLQSQLPIALSDTRAPEPDFAVVRGRRLDYRGRHPGPGDVIVVGEVADSSLDYDRTIKQRLYATAGIELYWIVNVIDNVVEVYRRPDVQAGVYRVRSDFQNGQSVELELPDSAVLTLAVDAILG